MKRTIRGVMHRKTLAKIGNTPKEWTKRD